MFQITRAVILAGLITMPQAVFSQTVALPPGAAVPAGTKEAAAKDDHSYLPPSMQGQPQAPNKVEAKNGTPAEALGKKAGKLANQHVRRDHHYYAEDSRWAHFDD